MILRTNKGDEVIVDDSLDLSGTSGKVWMRNAYAAVYVRSIQKTVSLHRFVIGAKDHQLVDHIDGNRLDCRRQNLRICNIRENSLNRSVQGFHRVKGRPVFRARAGAGRNRVNLGHHPTKEAAIEAYRKYYESIGAIFRPRIKTI